MKPTDFTKQTSGRIITAKGDYLAFVPNPLPPKLDLNWGLVSRLSDADRAMAELAGIARNLPKPHLLIRPFVRREAVLSSRIEGTQASLSDLVVFEGAEEVSPRVPEVREVANYVHALEYGLSRLAELPLSLRLIRELHERLMENVRGGYATPGEFRRSQNWIGPPGCTLADATYVPPPVAEMNEALDQFEKYLHSASDLPLLIRLALVHYQFEAIHPFLDGNGRIGRLLIILLLGAEKALPQPVLYLSAFFERRRQDYYERLIGVTRAGRWAEWIDFFLAGVAEESRDAVLRTAELMSLWQDYRDKVTQARSSGLLQRLIDLLFETPAITIPRAARLLGVTHRSATQNIQKLVRLGMLQEVTGRKRGQIFVAKAVLDASEKGLQLR